LAYDEPDNFAGLKFGEDLTKQMEKCPHGSSGLPDQGKIRALGTRCYAYPLEKGQIITYGLYNMGEIQHEVKGILAQQLDGKLVEVGLYFESSKASVLLSILNQRYGKPTDQSQQPWMSKGGIKATSTHAVWKGRNVSITLVERASKIDEGYITYDTEAWTEYLRHRRLETIKKGASGL
jgi:hypothetical protein